MKREAVKGTQTLTATIAPANATNKNITWSSSNSSVATVSEGVVTGVSTGIAKITARTVDGGFTGDCTVTVINPTGTEVRTFSELQTAVNNASTTASTRIIVAADIPFTKSISITKGKNITIISSGNRCFTLTAAANNRHFTVSSGASFTLENITLDGGYPGTGTTRRGGIDNGGNLTLNSGAVIQKCYSSWSGGGIDSSGVVEINGGKIESNKARDYGGGIANYDKGTLKINGGVISNNTAGIDGGGVNNYRSTITVNDSVFSGNKAGNCGGGIANSESTVTVKDSKFVDNIAEDDGGGISTWKGTAKISGGEFRGNKAIVDGGGIASWSCTIDVSGSKIVNNTAGNNGGGFYVGSIKEATVSDTIFQGNTAKRAYWMNNAADIATYKKQVTGVTKFSDPPAGNKSFEYAYNNYDISYTKGLTSNR